MHRGLPHRLERLALPLAFLVALSAALINPLTVVAAPAAAQPSHSPWVKLAMNVATPLLQAIDRLNGAQAVSTGSDGRLTFLLLGSDSRGTGLERMDTIMIASVKGNQISMASIPRDTARVPNPFGGGTFPGKVNGIVRLFLHAGYTQTQALDRFEIVIEDLLQIEIDYRAVVWFNGLTTLVDTVDPITVSIPKEIKDPHQEDDKTPGYPRGVYFPQAGSYDLYAYNPNGRPYCNGLYKNDTTPPVDAQYWCHRALPFVRSRKGPSNNDWIREARQQGFVAGAIKAVSSGELYNLWSTATNQGGGRWMTDLPVTYANALDIYNRLQGAYLAHSVVFKPYTYATAIAGTSGWALKLPQVRAWTAAYMK